MTKRAPDDPRGFSNRAAALIKLMAFPQAVQDCDDALKRDPKFIRAYIRKAQALQAMKEYNRVLDVLEEAREHDTEGKHTREIEQQQQKALEAQYSARAGETEQETAERIQRDPEVSQFWHVRLPYEEQELTHSLDHVHPAGSRHAEHSPAGQERPDGSAGAHEERPGPDEDPETDGCRCHSPGPVDLKSLLRAVRFLKMTRWREMGLAWIRLTISIFSLINFQKRDQRPYVFGISLFHYLYVLYNAIPLRHVTQWSMKHMHCFVRVLVYPTIP